MRKNLIHQATLHIIRDTKFGTKLIKVGNKLDKSEHFMIISDLEKVHDLSNLVPIMTSFDSKGERFLRFVDYLNYFLSKSSISVAKR